MQVWVPFPEQSRLFELWQVEGVQPFVLSKFGDDGVHEFCGGTIAVELPPGGVVQ